MKVYNMVSPRTGEKVANQFIISDKGTTTFQSYDSTIAVIDWNEMTIKVGKDWNYSVTTSKYRNEFFKEFPQLSTTSGMKKIMDIVKRDGFAFVNHNYYEDDFEVRMIEE